MEYHKPCVLKMLGIRAECSQDLNMHTLTWQQTVSLFHDICLPTNTKWIFVSQPMLYIYPFPSSSSASPATLHCVWKAVSSTESQQDECSFASSSPPDFPFLPGIPTYPVRAAPLWPAEYGANLLWTAHHWPLSPVGASRWSPASHWPWTRCVFVCTV